MATSKTTIRDIAERTGYSVATISKALNGLPDIGEETTRRVREIAEEMGYIPNNRGRALRTSRSHTIGLLWFLRSESVWTHELFAKMARGLQSIVEVAGYDLTPISCNSALEGRYLSYCRYRGYDGVIIMSSGYREEGLTELIRSEIPVVTIDYAYPSCGCVMADQRASLTALLTHVYELGHRKIAYVYSDADSAVAVDRARAFDECAARLGLRIPPEYKKPADFRNEEISAQATRELLSLAERPTCILYPDDLSAVGGMRALTEAGLSIPGDVSVVGYDNIPMSAYLQPPLTTYDQDGDEIGRSAGRLILNAIEKSRGASERVTVTGRLISRLSVADLRAR